MKRKIPGTKCCFADSLLLKSNERRLGGLTQSSRLQVLTRSEAILIYLGFLAQFLA